MKKLFILLMFICVSSFSLIAEHNNSSGENKPVEIKLSIGWTFGCYKETTFSNITQNIMSPKYQLEAKFNAGNFMHKIALDYYFSKPESAMTKTAVVYKNFDPFSGETYYEAFNSNLSFHKIQFQYDLNYKFIKNESFSLFAGGSFLCNAFLQFEHYPSITGLVSIGRSYEMMYKINGHNSISFASSIPLLGYGVRPSYAGCDAKLMKYAEEDFLKILTLGSFLSLHNYQSILFKFDYKVRASEYFSTGLGLDFEYARIAVPKERPLYYVNGNFKTFVMINF